MNHFLAAVILLNTKSKGSVTLKSKNPKDAPVIDLGYFKDPIDMETMIQGGFKHHNT